MPHPPARCWPAPSRCPASAGTPPTWSSPSPRWHRHTSPTGTGAHQPPSWPRPTRRRSWSPWCRPPDASSARPRPGSGHTRCGSATSATSAPRAAPSKPSPIASWPSCAPCKVSGRNARSAWRCSSRSTPSRAIRRACIASLTSPPARPPSSVVGPSGSSDPGGLRQGWCVTTLPALSLLVPGTRHLSRPLPSSVGPEETAMTQTSKAGMLCLIAGTLIITGELLRLTTGLLSGPDSAATVTHTLTYGLALAGMYALLLALTAVYVSNRQALGVLGLVGYGTAAAGTVLVAGDWWFEAFAVPMIAAEAPGVLELPPGGSVLAGALVTVGLFAAGWIAFGVAV